MRSSNFGWSFLYHVYTNSFNGASDIISVSSSLGWSDCGWFFAMTVRSLSVVVWPLSSGRVFAKKVRGGAHDRWISSAVTLFAVRFWGADGTGTREMRISIHRLQ